METRCIEWSQWKRDPQDPCLEVRYCLEYEKIEEKEPSLISKILGSETVGKIKKFSAIEPNGGGGSGSSDDDNDDEYGDDFVPEIRLDVYNKYINNENSCNGTSLFRKNVSYRKTRTINRISLVQRR